MAPPGGPIDDLVRDAVAGRPEAVDALYARVAPRVLSYVRMRMGQSLRERMDSRDIPDPAPFRQKDDVTVTAEAAAMRGCLCDLGDIGVRGGTGASTAVANFDRHDHGVL